MTPAPGRPAVLGSRRLSRALATAGLAAVALAGVVAPAGAAPATEVTAAALATSTTTATLSPYDVVVGSPVTLTVSVAGEGGVPTGSVRATVTHVGAGDQTTIDLPLEDGAASTTLTDLAVGSHYVNVAYAGDSTFAASTGYAGWISVVDGTAPTVTSVSPAVLDTTGGATVEVRGTKLRGATSVTFDGAPGRILTRSDDLVVVEAPPHAAGTGPVVVTTPAGTSGSSVTVQFVDAGQGVVSIVPVRIETFQPYYGQAKCLQVAGTNGIPDGASGVTLNVTTAGAQTAGYVLVYPEPPAGTYPPTGASTVNLEPGRDVANAAFVALSDEGRLCFRTEGLKATVILDVTGFTMPGSGIELRSPVRLLDTRPAYSIGDVKGPLQPGAVRTLQVTGRAGVPADATAVILNATATSVAGLGNLRIFPAGQDVPNTSVLNYAPGADKANAAIVALSPEGTLSIYSDGSSANVVLDVTGYVTADSVYDGVTPSRALDTRPGAGHVGSITGPLQAQHAYTFTVPDAVVPDGATAVVLNVTAIGPNKAGNLRVYPSGQATPPNASTLNYIPGRDIPNLVVVDLPDSGPATVSLFSDTATGGTVHVAADVAGFVVP